MGLFDKPDFDFDRDGKVDDFETFMGLQMTAASRKEAIILTGDDHFYPGPDTLETDNEDV